MVIASVRNTFSLRDFSLLEERDLENYKSLKLTHCRRVQKHFFIACRQEFHCFRVSHNDKRVSVNDVGYCVEW